MSIKFETVKPLNVGGMKMIPIKTNEGKQLFCKDKQMFFVRSKKGQKIQDNFYVAGLRRRYYKDFEECR